MGFFRQVLTVFAVASITLLVAAAGCAALLLIASLIWPTSGSSSLGQSLIVPGIIVAYTMIFGLPSILAVALLYATLDRFGQAKWYFVLPLAMVPGLVLWRSNQSVGVVALAAGVFVGAATHWTMTQWQHQTGPKVVV